MRRDSSFCAKSVRYNIFTNGTPYLLPRCEALRTCRSGFPIAKVGRRWKWRYCKWSESTWMNQISFGSHEKQANKNFKT